MDVEGAQNWLDRYVAAWKSYDRDEIAALFSDDVAYRYHPSDQSVVGREAVVDSWLVDGDVVVATGTSWYRETPDGPVVRVYDNCFVMRFDSADRCREFTEYYVRRP